MLIHKYVPPHLIPERIEEITMDELCDLIARAKIYRELWWEDIQMGICKAFPPKE